MSHAKTRSRKGNAVLCAVASLREQIPHRLLIGVSGGSDSVALLHALVKLGWKPHVCHLNHQWRGTQSKADAEFVRQLAKKLGLPATIGSRKVAHTEAAARQARQAFFERVAKKTGIGTLVLAHTADDQVETFLMRLIRGAGPTGLAGMRTVRQMGKLTILRPMLNVRRKEVLQFLNAEDISFRDDASNTDRRFLRNRIRHELLPLLERDYNPRIRDALLRTAEILRAEAEKEPAAWQRREIRRQLGDLDFRQVEEVRKRITGKWPVRCRGVTRIPTLGIRLAVHSPNPCNICYKKMVIQEAALDARVLGSKPFIRTWRPGDRFQPLGMTGEKKLQDFFVDEKVPRRERERVPLLCATDGRIAWVVGYRISDAFKITSATRRVLHIACEPGTP